MDDSSELEILADLSSSGSERGTNEDALPVRRVQRRAEYQLSQRFETVEEYQLWRDEGNLSGWNEKNKKRLNNASEVIYYTCLTKECGMRMKIVFSGTDESIKIETDTAGHNQEAHDRGTKLTLQMKRRITELAESKKPKAIRLQLLEEFEMDRVPTLLQVQNFVAQLNRKKTPSKPLTDADLINYASKNSAEPNDRNQAFVVGFLPVENEHFLLVWSTTHLIGVQQRANLLATDATYKLNWYGFPVFIAGTVDINLSFHPTFLALSSHEDEFCFSKFFDIIFECTGQHPTHILADGARSITNAAFEIFPDAIRLMCWAHVVKNVDQRLKSLPAETKTQIRHEINLLQFATSEEQFSNVAEQLLEKWKQDYDEDLPFINYFCNTWVESEHFRWFEGASCFPSTNNALEAKNKQIKDLHSLRERLPFNRFTIWAEKMVGTDWSKSHEDPSEIEIKIKPHLYVEARTLHNNTRQVFVLRSNEKWAIPSTEYATLNSREVKQLVRLLESSTFESFEAFAINRFKVHVITKTRGTYACTCRVGAKKHYCKHIIFIGCKTGDFSYPPDALAEPLSRKAKRGRPKKAETQSQARN